tara:strand:+ start:801 stop:2813 length:2013 start_codon:yes stop_codon:yes gene_type:complete
VAESENLLASFIFSLFLCASSISLAQQTARNHPLAPLLEENCATCHGPATQTAGIDLTSLIQETPLVKNLETWNRVIGALEVGKMPPPGAPQPSQSERAAMLALLRQDIDQFDFSTIDNPGFELMRRLTHAEYDNTVRDLFGVELNITERFPAELIGNSGFENSSNTLFLQSSLMERYIGAAQTIIDLALPAEPTSEIHYKTRELIFVNKPSSNVSEQEASEAVLEAFLSRAFRRPITNTELFAAAQQFAAARSSGLTYEGSIKQVIQSSLISPKFLLRVELSQEEAASFRINDYELASRLSYFLWASMPDEELFELAAAGRLNDAAVLQEQVSRMLADEKANTLGDLFAAQWLGFHNVGTRIWLDPIDQPWCTDSLMTAMRDETSMFFMALLRDDLPIRSLIDANFTFVNEELAKTLYGMDDIKGEQMRRVSVVDPNRGGVLGHASVLALTSNYTTTSPVKRGVYVLDTILGTPPPEPPPNVGVLSQELQEIREMSFREKVEMHSANEYCRGCHSRIDPIGFSMENFSFFGQWRDTYDFRARVDSANEADESVTINTESSPDPITIHFKTTSRPISAEGSLPDGESFDGPAGLKAALLRDRHDELVRQVVSKMLAYSLGRQLEYYDEPAIRKIISSLESNGYKFKTLLSAIVASYPFQYKKNPNQEVQL